MRAKIHRFLAVFVVVMSVSGRPMTPSTVRPTHHAVGGLDAGGWPVRTIHSSNTHSVEMKEADTQYMLLPHQVRHNGYITSKVIDLGAYRKRVCDFLLVININFGHACFTNLAPV